LYLTEENDDSVSIAFDPFEGALDYRVYPLPADGDITVASDGHVTVHNGTYRCAGDRESPTPNIEDAGNTGAWVTTKVDQEMVGGYLRTMADAVINLASSIDMLEEAVEAVERGEEPCPPGTSGTSSSG